LCQKNQTLVVLGAGGKAGTLCCVAGRKKVGSKGRVIAIEPRKEAAEELEKLKVCSDIVQVNAKDPIAVSRSIEKLTRGKMGDVVVNVASVPDTEMAALLSVAPKGKVLFFGMATSFSKVVLGAEGIAASASLFFGNGYIKNHSQIAIDLVRKNSSLKELFYRRYGANS
jgi:L-erythro-3,5-diaminohexanoate dehydrogenase